MEEAKAALVSPYGSDGSMRQLWEMEAEVIEYAMRLYRGNVSQVARQLGIGRSTLCRRLERYEDLKRREQKTALATETVYRSAA